MVISVYASPFHRSRHAIVPSFYPSPRHHRHGRFIGADEAQTIRLNDGIYQDGIPTNHIHMRVNSTTTSKETNLPFTVGFTRHGVIYPEPTLSLDICPPIRVDFIASHDDVACVDALARPQFFLYFTDAAGDDGQ
jgi:hypothetical protein